MSNEIRSFLPRTANFAEAFPTIDDARMNVVETSHEPGFSRVRHYSKGDLIAIVPCSNSKCNRGGVELEALLRLMVDRGKTNDTWECHCSGDEGSLGGRRKGPPCTHSFKVSVYIKYHD